MEMVSTFEIEELGIPFEAVVEDEITVAPGRIQNSPMGDDGDWCESSAICHRPITDWSNETKENAAFGNAGGVVGNRLEEPLQYDGSVKGCVFAAGYGPMGLPPLPTEEFYCPSIVDETTSCSFLLE